MQRWWRWCGGVVGAMALAVLVLPAVATPAFAATPDPVVLVGTWQGEIDTAGARWSPTSVKGRILIIQSVVKQDDGKWVPTASYAAPGDPQFDQVKASLEVGDNIQLQFFTPSSKTKVTLTLSDAPPWTLAGVMMTYNGVFRLQMKKISDSIAKTPN